MTKEEHIGLATRMPRKEPQRSPSRAVHPYCHRKTCDEKTLQKYIILSEDEGL